MLFEILRKQINRKFMVTFFDRIISFFVTLTLRLLSKFTKKNMLVYKDNLVQFIKFGIVGLSNTMISYLSYFFLLLYFKKISLFNNVEFLVAQIFSFLIGVIWTFYWNNLFVFKNDCVQKLFYVFFKVLLSYSFTGLFLNSVFLLLWIKCLHVSEYIAPMINLLISVPLNFILNKKWAFRE